MKRAIRPLLFTLMTASLLHCASCPPNGEKSCAERAADENNCNACTSIVGCGWCGEPDSIDPEAGRCMEGEQARPAGCEAAWTWAHNTTKCPQPPPVVDPDLD